ncbi:MAG: hypothetical protein LBQ16_00170 [Gracilibacteraceae bacterium]|jgi:hypothetical protein|nr:hypothetical protein [Gracilibacteraceae bacterium]
MSDGEKILSPDGRNQEKMRLGYVEMAGINLSIARENAREEFILSKDFDYLENY